MFQSGREKERETLEGDNLFASEASSAAVSPWDPNRAAALQREAGITPICSDRDEIIPKIHARNLTTSRECSRRVGVIRGGGFGRHILDSLKPTIPGALYRHRPLF